MKRKFINGLLLVAMVFASMSAFVSCKDTDGDNYADMQGKLADQNKSLRDYIGDVEAALQAQLDALKAAHQADSTAFADKIKELEAAIAAIKQCDCGPKWEALATTITNLQAQDSILQDGIDAINAQLPGIINRIKEIEDDYVKHDEIANFATKQELADSIAKLTGLIHTAQATADAAGIAADSAWNAAKNAQAAADSAWIAAKNAQAAADSAQVDATKALQDAQDAKKVADAAQKLAKENKGRIDTLESTVTDLTDRVGALETRMYAVEAKADSALAQANLAYELAKADSILIENLLSRVETNESNISDLQTSMTEAENRLTTAEHNIEAAQALAEEADSIAKEATEKAIAALDSVDVLSTRVGEVETLLETEVDNLQDQIDDLNDALNDLLDKFKESLLNQISGIILQGTYNSVTGSGALPLDVRSMILAAFHGTSTQTINFPTPKAEAYVYPTRALTEKDFEMLEGVQKTQIASGQILIQNDAAEGNAGTLYLTVNPNTVDFSGVNFSLVNSQDKVSPMTLGALKASDATLSFGYTRAAKNGFYEAPVTLTKECIGKVGARLDLTKSDIKQIAEGMIQSLKNVKNGNDVDFNFLNVYNTFLRAADDIWDAQGVKAAWTNVNGDAQSVVSQYNLLATSVKPLSYNFLKGYNVKDIPTIDPISFNVEMEIDSAHWEPINWPSVTMYVWVVYVPVNGVNTVVGVYDTEAAAQAKAAEYSGATIEKMKFTVDGMADLTAKIDSWGKKVSTDNVQDLIDQIKGQVDSNVDRVINKINSKVIANLNKIINKVNKYLDNANYYIQPNMYYINDKGSFQILSTHKFIPCVFQGTEAPLFPTSLTAEIFAPAYKKFVAVTNVYKPDMTASAQSGDATCLNALKSTNSGSTMFNEVFDGTKMGVVFKPAAKGLVYEIAYTAVDYQGQVACQKFYVYTK